jgi:hypothetical protein
MRYTIKTVGVLIEDWQALRVAVFGNAQPIFEQFGGGAPYIVEFATPQTPADLGPLVRVEIFDPTAPRLP